MAIVKNSKYGVLLMGGGNNELSERQYWETRWTRCTGLATIVLSMVKEGTITEEEKRRLMDLIYSPDEENLTVAEAIVDELIKP